MNKRKKFDKFAKRRLILLIVIILIVALFIILNVKKDSNNYENYRLIIGGEYIDLKHDIYVDSLDNIYLSKQDMQDLYDNNIYYDSVENMLITTFNKHIAKLELDNKVIEINGSKIESNATLIKLGEEIYLPFSEMGIVYDFEYYYSKDSKTVVVDSISEENSNPQSQLHNSASIPKSHNFSIKLSA